MVEERKKYILVLPVVFILSCAYILSIPRTYSSRTALAPEVGGSKMNSGTLGSIASTFGLDLSAMQSVDAITPLLYPELMEDYGFVASLLDIKVKSQDGTIKTNYFDYKNRHQKQTWWMNIFKSQEDNVAHKPHNLIKDPYNLSKAEEKIIKNIQKSIKITVDIKTNIITITTTEQDPLIAKTMADSVRNHLQQFITSYRTNKARNDMEYYRKITVEAKNNYEKARRLYAAFSDANTDLILESVKAKQEDLENDMQLKFNTYSALNTQYQAAIAKVQERMPAFTILQGASVPTKPSGPKRMVFVLACMILSVILLTIYIMRKDFKKLMISHE